MDATQFATFMKAFQDTIKALAPADKGKGTSSSSSSSTSCPKISIKIPTYKGEPNENVVVWTRQVKNIFHAQNIKDEGTMIHYAATGLEDAALHWFVNKVKDTSTSGPAFSSWNNFSKALKEAFQPPNYQHYLRIQLKTLRQTSTVQEYGMRFRNIIEQIDTMNELNKVSYFVDGLKSVTSREVAYQAPVTFEDT